MPTPTFLDLGSVVGPDIFSVWCSKQAPALDPGLGASWDAYMAAIKGETGETGAPGADGLTQEQVDARIAAANLQAALTFDDAPTSASANPVKSGGVFSALAQKQATLEWDSTPTAASTKPVTSGGVHAAIAAASIGDTGWVSMSLNGAVVSSGSIKYRVKNGVIFLSGSFVVNASGINRALTTSEIPAECMPSTEYGTIIRVPATEGVWRIADVFLKHTDRKLYMNGVADIRTGSPLGSVNVTLTLNDCSWVLPAAS